MNDTLARAAASRKKARRLVEVSDLDQAQSLIEAAKAAQWSAFKQSDISEDSPEFLKIKTWVRREHQLHVRKHLSDYKVELHIWEKGCVVRSCCTRTKKNTLNTANHV
jgi:hypothetical protein